MPRFLQHDKRGVHVELVSVTGELPISCQIAADLQRIHAHLHHLRSIAGLQRHPNSIVPRVTQGAFKCYTVGLKKQPS
jgi:hypothetical protein